MPERSFQNASLQKQGFPRIPPQALTQTRPHGPPSLTAASGTYASPCVKSCPPASASASSNVFRRKPSEKLVMSLLCMCVISVACGMVGARCPGTTIPHHCLPSHTWSLATGVTYSCINTAPLQLQWSSLSDFISPFHLHVLPSLSQAPIPVIYDSVTLSLFWEHSPTLLPQPQAPGRGSLSSLNSVTSLYTASTVAYIISL